MKQRNASQQTSSSLGPQRSLSHLARLILLLAGTSRKLRQDLAELLHSRTTLAGLIHLSRQCVSALNVIFKQSLDIMKTALKKKKLNIHLTYNIEQLLSILSKFFIRMYSTRTCKLILTAKELLTVNILFFKARDIDNKYVRGSSMTQVSTLHVKIVSRENCTIIACT